MALSNHLVTHRVMLWSALRRLDFELGGPGFLHEVLLQDEKWSKSPFGPEESAAGYERGLPLELVEAR
ncbi:hypothetical protein ACFX13_041938 [Malus domestica]